MNIKKIKTKLKDNFNPQRLIYKLLFVFLIANFLLLIGLMKGGSKIANSLEMMAETNMKQTRIMSIIAERQMNPLFEIEKENFKKEENE